MKLKHSGMLLVAAQALAGYFICPCLYFLAGMTIGLVRDCWRMDI